MKLYKRLKTLRSEIDWPETARLHEFFLTHKSSIQIHVTTLVSTLILVYVMLFERRNLLLAHAIQPTVYAAKFIIPVLLFFAIALAKPYSQYLTLFVCFFWLIDVVGTSSESIYQLLCRNNNSVVHVLTETIIFPTGRHLLLEEA